MESEIRIYNNSSDQDYINAINTKYIRDHINSMWNEYKEFADKDFEKKLSEDYWPRIWEMSLGIILKQNKLNIIKNRRIEGPDLSLEFEKKKIYIEAVCPSAGDLSNPDAVIENNIIQNDDGEYIGVFKEIEFEKMELRLSSAIFDKAKKIGEYITKGIVNRDDIFIIAISSSRIPNTNYSFGEEMGIELNILRTILPIGPTVVSISDLKNGVFSERIQFKEYNVKSNSEKIAKNIFLDSLYQNISAIIFSSAKYPFSVNANGQNVYIIKNPNCAMKLKCDFGLKEIEIEVGETYCKYRKKNYE